MFLMKLRGDTTRTGVPLRRRLSQEPGQMGEGRRWCSRIPKSFYCQDQEVLLCRSIDCSFSNEIVVILPKEGPHRRIAGQRWSICLRQGRLCCRSLRTTDLCLPSLRTKPKLGLLRCYPRSWSKRCYLPMGYQEIAPKDPSRFAKSCLYRCLASCPSFLHRCSRWSKRLSPPSRNQQKDLPSWCRLQDRKRRDRQKQRFHRSRLDQKIHQPRRWLPPLR